MDATAAVFLGVPNYRQVLAPGFDLLREAGIPVLENMDAALGSVTDTDHDLAAITVAVSGLETWGAAEMDACENLRGIVKSGTGVDNIDLAAAKERGIIVGNTPGLNANAVAELAVSHMLAALRHLGTARTAILAGDTTITVGQELSGKTVGIVGFGTIGRRVMQLLTGFGVDVLVSDPQVPTDQPGVEVVELEELLERSDIVSLHAPAIPATHGMIDADALRRMKPTAVLVNTSRGLLIDEAALLDALDRGVIYGAALDVFVQVPPSPGHPLVTHPRVFATNHAGAATVESDRQVAIATAEGAIQILQGRDPDSRLV